MKELDIKKIKPNPNNPRLIKDEKFKKLVKSLQEFPEMLEKRPLVCVTDVDGKVYPLGGNMRLKAAQELGMKELPVTLADDWTQEQRQQFVIKDNIGYGEWDWDAIANEWDAEQLSEWGLDLPGFAPEKEIDDLSDTIKTEFRIEVICKDEEEQEKTYNKLIEQNYECRLLAT
jgi:ParB-like chromosome segregation protein Spo0J